MTASLVVTDPRSPRWLARLAWSAAAAFAMAALVMLAFVHARVPVAATE